VFTHDFLGMFPAAVKRYYAELLNTFAVSR
jgi:hypothetical protein